MFNSAFICSENISDAPSITPNSTSYNFTEGNDIELRCDTGGRPQPTVTWTKIGESSSTVYPDRQTLIITNANRTEAGTYRCTATNGIGNSASAAIHVNIFCKYLIDILEEFALQLTINADIHSFIFLSKQPPLSLSVYLFVCPCACLSV